MGAKLDELMKRVNKETKDDSFVKGMLEYDYEKIPFTSPKMNYITYGGLPLGRLVEFFGEEGGGKTTTALDIVANFQNLYPDREVLYVDAENTLDIEWARKIGVDVDSLNLYQPKTESAEYICQVIKDATNSGEIGLWVLDSIPCLTSENDLDKDLTDSARVAGVSGILTRFGREIVGPCAKNNCMGIGINQVRDKIGSQIPGVTTPGGRGWRHFCTTRIQFTTGSYMNEDGKNISKSAEGSKKRIIQVNMVKTKACRPDRHVGHYTIDFDTGIDYLSDLIEQAMFYNIVEKAGAWFTIVNPDSGEIIADKIQGQNRVVKYLDENPEIMEQIEGLLSQKMGIDL